MSITEREVIQYLSHLTPFELAGLVKALETQWNVQASASLRPPPPPDPVPDLPTRFDLVLVGVGTSRLQVVRALRKVRPELGLGDCRALTAQVPVTVFEGLEPAKAESLAATLREAGAEVQLRS